jgi:hypothetical protein
MQATIPSTRESLYPSHTTYCNTNCLSTYVPATRPTGAKTLSATTREVDNPRVMGVLTAVNADAVAARESTARESFL